MTRAIDPTVFRSLIVVPALQAIGLWSLAAEQLVTGTALQESGLEYLHQINGPALGFFQMEPATYNDIWHNYLASNSQLASQIMRTVAVPGLFPVDQHCNEMIGNAYYAAAMCRVLYRRIPEALPAAGDLAGQAAYYKQHYNTPAGAATVVEYIANWRAAFPEEMAA